MWINNSSIFRYDIYWTQSLAVLDSYDVRQQSALFDKDAEKKKNVFVKCELYSMHYSQIMCFFFIRASNCKHLKW